MFCNTTDPISNDGSLNNILKHGFPQPLFQSFLCKRLFRFFVFSSFSSSYSNVFRRHFSTRFQIRRGKQVYDSRVSTSARRFSNIFTKTGVASRCNFIDLETISSRTGSTFEIKLFPIANDVKRDLEEVIFALPRFK